MLSLNRDILFDVGKKIIEEGNFDALIRFALSGRRHLAVLPHVFASVTTLKLFKHSCKIGWGDKCCTFNFKDGELPLISFLHQAGNCIQTLHIDARIPFSKLYQPIIGKIIHHKQLVSFSVGNNVDYMLIDVILNTFSSTLKNVSVPSVCLKSEFLGKIILDSLNVTDSIGTSLVSFCGKTSSLTFPFNNFNNMQQYENVFSRYHDFINPAVLPVKELIFEGYVPSDYYGPDPAKLQSMMQCFPSLKLIKLNIHLEEGLKIRLHVLNYIQIINEAIKFPSKIFLNFSVFNMRSFNRKAREEICDIGFEFEEIPDIYCFRKMVQSADSKPTILEVHVAAKKLCEIYSMLFELC